MQIAYVTGADRGLGLGLTKTLLSKGYRVFAGRYMDDWPELDDIARQYPEILTIVDLDVRDPESVNAASNRIRRESGRLNLLINNAGSARDRSGTIVDDFYFEDVRALMEINTYGPLRVTQSVLDLLLKAEPKTIFNISSLAGSVGSLTRSNQYGYVMTKAALNAQTKLIHNHFKDHGLTVRAIHPGWMRSHVFGDIERMKEAPFEPIDSARAIIALLDEERDVGDNIFIDYKGDILPW